MTVKRLWLKVISQLLVGKITIQLARVFNDLYCLSRFVLVKGECVSVCLHPCINIASYYM